MSLSEVVESIRRPYPVTLPMILFVSLIPLYIFIPALMPGRTVYAPELALDQALPLEPVWALVYGTVYQFLILLPILVVRQQESIRRTVAAYLLVWITAYVCFIAYPTVAPRPPEVAGAGFSAWGLRLLYSADPPYNCFPSLHVAHSFVSALACFRVHRRVGIFAIVCASCVAVSTLYTKQHYVLDAIAGILLALLAYALFLRGYSRERVGTIDRRLAPLFALVTAGIVMLVLAGFWLVYRLTG